MPRVISQAEEEASAARLSQQVVSFALHTVLALGSWLLLMLAGYALNPVSAPQFLILALSMFVPLVVGNMVTRFRQDEMGDRRVAGWPHLGAHHQLVGLGYAHRTERMLPVRRNRKAVADFIQLAQSQRPDRR